MTHPFYFVVKVVTTILWFDSILPLPLTLIKKPKQMNSKTLKNACSGERNATTA